MAHVINVHQTHLVSIVLHALKHVSSTDISVEMVLKEMVLVFVHRIGWVNHAKTVREVSLDKGANPAFVHNMVMCRGC